MSVPDHDAIVELIEYIRGIRLSLNGSPTILFIYVSLKCDGYIRFADTQMELLRDRQPDELAAVVADLRRGSMELKAECGKLIRKGTYSAAKEMIQTADDRLTVLFENITLLLSPELVEVFDAAL